MKLCLITGLSCAVLVTVAGLIGTTAATAQASAPAIGSAYDVVPSWNSVPSSTTVQSSTDFTLQFSDSPTGQRGLITVGVGVGGTESPPTNGAGTTPANPGSGTPPANSGAGTPPADGSGTPPVGHGDGGSHCAGQQCGLPTSSSPRPTPLAAPVCAGATCGASASTGGSGPTLCRDAPSCRKTANGPAQAAASASEPCIPECATRNVSYDRALLPTVAFASSEFRTEFRPVTETLAITGVDSTGIVAGGIFLLIIGAFALVVARRLAVHRT